MINAQLSNAPRAIRLTDAAIQRVSQLLQRHSHPGLMLRLSASNSDRVGFQYGFAFDTALGAEDRVFETDGVRLVADATSLDRLDGATLDYVEDPIGASFQVHASDGTLAPNGKTSLSL